jgi:hypothetical protein
MLEQAGAATTRARGHQGRFVASRDLGRLWVLAGMPQVRALLTPPGAVEVYGMAAGLSAEFTRLGVPLRIEYLRGARNRVAEAATGVSFAVVSKGLAAIAPDPSFEYITMKPWTYYARGSIVLLTAARFERQHPGAFRIGIDKESDDHLQLTNAEFSEPGHQFVHCPFPQVPTEILRGTIDAGIWHQMLLLIPPSVVGLVQRPLGTAAAEVARNLSPAVLAFPKKSHALATVLGGISFARIARVQRQMLTSSQDPLAHYNVWHR